MYRFLLRCIHTEEPRSQVSRISMILPVLLSSVSVSVFAGNDFEEAFCGAIKTVYLRMFLCTRILLCPGGD